jgi:hypothetical protein
MDAWAVIERIGAIGGLIALGLGIWLSLRALGFFLTRKHSVSSTYLPHRDAIGFDAMPHFVLEYENLGDVPVVFSDFELMLPRTMFRGDTFIDHPGATLLIDKRKSSTVGGIKEFSRIDYRTNKVRLQPSESHTDFFDLGAFLEDFDDADPLPTGRVPADFDPILQFRDSYGNEFYCDADGVHTGPYKHAELDKLLAKGVQKTLPRKITAARDRWRPTWRFTGESGT